MGHKLNKTIGLIIWSIPRRLILHRVNILLADLDRLC